MLLFPLLPKLFQFHKGTIKTGVVREEVEQNQNFNSIKVRLKREFVERCRTIWTFQFHKGTIKTCLDCVQMNRDEISIP